MVDAKNIVLRWEKIGFLKDIKNEKKEIAACFYENLANILDEYKYKENYQKINFFCFIVAKNLVENQNVFGYLEKSYLKFISRYMLDEMFNTFNNLYIEDDTYCTKFAEKFSKDYIIYF